MIKLKRFDFLVILALGLTFSPAQGQTAKEIASKMIGALGGDKALESVKDQTISGTVEIIQMRIKGSMTGYQKEPNKVRLDLEFMGKIITQAFDGEKAWYTNPQTGTTELMPEQLAKEFRRNSLGNAAILHPEAYGITYEFGGKEQVKNKEYLILEEKYEDGYKKVHYIDQETYLIYKTRSKTLNQQTGVEMDEEEVFSDYRKIENCMVPHAMSIYQDGQEYMTMIVTKVIFNSGLDDSVFRMNMY
jgi:outer membrane lipoprotein-sorting protein